MDHLRRQLDSLYPKCLDQKGAIGQDLMKMWRTANRQLALCDQELVNCRRLNRETIRYKELVEAFAQTLEQLEKRITWVALVY